MNGILRKRTKKLSKTLAEAVSELQKELPQQTEQAQSKRDQQQWRGTPLPSNQPTMESLW